MTLFSAKKRKVLCRGDDGFSLMEIIIVMLFLSFLTVPLYSIVMGFGQTGSEEDRMDIIRQGLAEHYRVYGYLPCPSDIALANNHVDFDRADCSVTSHSNPNGIVYVGALPIQNLRDAMGCTQIGDEIVPFPDRAGETRRSSMRSVKDAIKEGDSVTDPTITNNRARGKCITRAHIRDEYGSKYIYAVSRKATRLSDMDILDPTVGAVRIVDENGVAVTANDQLFALVSVGPDRKGGTDIDGAANGPACGAVAAAFDNENCNYTADAVFRSMPFVNAGGQRHYDDMVDFSLAGGLIEDNVWQWSENTSDPTLSSKNIYFGADSRILLDQVELASGSVSLLSAEDKLVVGRGNILLQSDGAGRGGKLEVIGTSPDTGNIDSETVDGKDDVVAEDAVVAPKFCYPAAQSPFPSLVNDCD